MTGPPRCIHEEKHTEAYNDISLKNESLGWARPEPSNDSKDIAEMRLRDQTEFKLKIIIRVGLIGGMIG